MPESRQGGGVGKKVDPMQEVDPQRSLGQGGDPSTVLDPLLGRTINGRFKIVSVIARGGMGKVYKAEQAPLGRICALKVLSPKYEGDRDPEFHKRFFLEASTAAKLSHANTVTIFDYGQADDEELYYIAMEYIEGRTLHRVLREEGPFAEGRVAHIAAQICRSLREAHGMGVVHRDLKPGNIMLSDKGDERDNVKVLDFGLVKDVSGEAEDLTQAGLFMGSPKYMAPEQILGGEISPRTDIYSLGVMIYEMLSGKVPFDRGASVGTLMAHVNDPVPAMRSSNPNLTISIAMEGIVRRCLDKEPAKRFPSMKDLLHALKRAGGEEGALDTSENLPVAIVPPPRVSQNGVLSPNVLASPSLTDLGGHPVRRTSETEITAVPSESNAPAPILNDSSALFSHARATPRRKTYLWAIAVGVVAALAVAMIASKSRQTGATTDPTATPSTSESAAVAPPPPPVTSSATQVVSAAPPSPTERAAVPNGPRTVHVESDPAGATVSESGTELCPATPCDVVIKGDGADHKLSISKKGFKTLKQVVTPADPKVSVKLDSTTTTGGGGPVIKGPSPFKPDPYKPDPYK